MGTGISLPGYSKGSRIVGVDISEDMLDKARDRVRKLGLAEHEFQLDLMKLYSAIWTWVGGDKFHLINLTLPNGIVTKVPIGYVPYEPHVVHAWAKTVKIFLTTAASRRGWSCSQTEATRSFRTSGSIASSLYLACNERRAEVPWDRNDPFADIPDPIPAPQFQTFVHVRKTPWQPGFKREWWWNRPPINWNARRR